jgi:hypothetical protein
MKFVVTIDHGVEYAGSWEENVPLEYDSKEALYVDLNLAVQQALKDRVEEFSFAGKCFYSSWFSDVIPDEPVTAEQIETLDEWFARAYLASDKIGMIPGS